MNAELLALTKSGWSIVDVKTADDREEVEDTPPSRDEAEAESLPECVEREGAKVTVGASQANVSVAQALAVLRREATLGFADIVIHDAEGCDEPPYQTVESWCGALGEVGSSTLKRFIVDTYFQPLTRQASVACGDIT